MSLTTGPGPLAHANRGRFNVDLSAAPAHLLYLHAVPQRVRGVLAGQTVVDTERAVLLHESALLPQWYVPREDVRFDLLTPTATSTHCPFKGDAVYWSLTVGDRVVEDAVWGYPEPLDAVPELAGLVAFYFGKLDAWYEEDELVFGGHPRDPFHRVDTRRSSRPVTVTVGGTVVARTDRAVALYETGLPTRWYLPREAVDPAALTASDTRSECPYKGVASYAHLTVDGTRREDLLWSYVAAFPEAQGAAGYWGVDDSAEDVEVLVG
ncbi:hypothetical protein ASG36_07280 [Geodermatophilus sp. Leaf369]|uniref:DUF427 domain-containing protein n=1 Tax=Geodermatophilus sp. Leaf369 TaxID=1736354 RepID=UPI0006FD15EA|nr:DUF427 domain-containing protein [Geodermatophilus sp. Leaf369]KQS60680.1 hypothetical protein ASG36_07280 [Geodermatophilus sp. Leaf369]